MSLPRLIQLYQSLAQDLSQRVGRAAPGKERSELEARLGHVLRDLEYALELEHQGLAQHGLLRAL